MPKLGEWVNEFSMGWLGTKKADNDVLAALGPDLEVIAAAHQMTYDERGASKERYSLLLTADRLIEVTAVRIPKTDQQPLTLDVKLSVYPLRWASSVQFSPTYRIQDSMTYVQDEKTTITFSSEAQLQDLVIPPQRFPLQDNERDQFYRLALAVTGQVK